MMTARELGDATRIRRRDLGLRQAELATLAGVSERLIRDIESGKPSLRMDTLMKVLDVLGFTLELATWDPLTSRQGVRR